MKNWVLRLLKVVYVTSLIAFFSSLVPNEAISMYSSNGPCQSDTLRQAFVIKGLVTTESNQPISGALATLTSLDSTFIKAALSNRDGLFDIAVPRPGAYQLRLSFIGKKEIRQKVTADEVHSATPPPFRMADKAVQLTEVTVRQTPPLFDLLADRIVVNVDGNAIISAGSTLDVLSKTPRVSVDQLSRSLSIDGRAGLVLFQNGHQVNRSGEQISEYLQNLPASSLTRIEVLTQPSAKYDASGGGVILLYTKSRPDEGLSGEATLVGAYGFYPKTSGSLSLTFKKNKLLASFLYTGLIRSTYFEYTSQQILSTSTNREPGFSYAEQFRRINTNNQTARLALDYQLAPNTTIGTVVMAGSTNEQVTPVSTIHYQLSAQTPLVGVSSINRFDSFFQNISSNINLRQTLPKTKGVLSGDLDYAFFHNDGSSTAAFTPFLPTVAPTQQLAIAFPLTVKIGAGKIDYLGPIARTGSWEMGLKYSEVRMNTVPVPNAYSADFAPLVPSLIVPFAYSEKTSAAYLSTNRKLSVYTIQIGLRLEHTNYVGTSRDSLVSQRRYTNLFPTLSISRTFSAQNQISLSYNERIVRPNYELLSPSFIFFDPITLGKGNPQLLPQLTRTVQAIYITRKKYNLTLSYLESKNRIAQALYRNDSTTATIINTTLNFDREQRLGFTLSVPLKLSSIWQLQVTATGTYSRFYTTFRDVSSILKQSTGLIQLTNNLKLGAWSFDALMQYRTTAAIGFLRYKPFFTMNLGVQRPIFKNKQGTVKLAATDVFKTLFSGNYGQYLNTDIAFHHTWESRVFSAVLTYRFGNRELKNMNRRGAGSDAEQERIKREF